MPRTRNQCANQRAGEPSALGESKKMWSCTASPKRDSVICGSRANAKEMTCPRSATSGLEAKLLRIGRRIVTFQQAFQPGELELLMDIVDDN